MSEGSGWVSLGLCVACCALAAAAALPPSSPRAGQWSLSVRLGGMPGGPQLRASQACIAAEALAAAPEQAFLDAAASASGGAALKCSVSDLRRTEAGARWTSLCIGPRGSMRGAGTDVLGVDQATLAQTFVLDTPLGPRDLTQAIWAQRLGDCP